MTTNSEPDLEPAYGLPASVKVGGLTYTVEVTPHISFGENYNGETLYRELKINIRPMEPDMMYRTFIHELLHAIMDNLGHNQHDEKQIDEMAGALFALIKDNPGIFTGGA
jgi:hypothetical protein